MRVELLLFVVSVFVCIGLCMFRRARKEEIAEVRKIGYWLGIIFAIVIPAGFIVYYWLSI